MKTRVAVFCLVPIMSLVVFSASQEKAPAGDEELLARAGEFLQLLTAGDFVGAVKNFDATMKKVFGPEKLAAFWKETSSRAGMIKSRDRGRVERSPSYDYVFVRCEFEKALLYAKIVFNRSGEIAGFSLVPPLMAVAYSPPAYVDLERVEERDVTVGEGEWALAGTLSLPKREGPFPAVVLVHGSGPNDRDEATGQAKPFRDLAWGLASRGIAVLRYDKRTRVHGGRYVDKNIFKSLTVKEETLDDALAAVSLLRRTGKIDPTRIFVLGHSLGGMLVPRIAAGDAAIAGFILMAGATRPIEDMTLEQTAYILNLDGALSESDKALLEKLKSQVDRVKALRDSDLDSDENILGAAPKYWLDLRGYNPPEEAKKVRQPMLILQGGRDYQVTTVDFENWKKALASREDVTFKFYPKANHLLIEGEGRSTPGEYAQAAGHVAAACVEDIAAWIHSLIKNPGA